LLVVHPGGIAARAPGPVAVRVVAGDVEVDEPVVLAGGWAEAGRVLVRAGTVDRGEVPAGEQVAVMAGDGLHLAVGVVAESGGNRPGGCGHGCEILHTGP